LKRLGGNSLFWEGIMPTKFFFVVGTGCSATTWLYKILRDIPGTQIEMYWCFKHDLKEIGKAYNSEQDANKYIRKFRKPLMLRRLKKVKIYGEINCVLRWHCGALKRAFPKASIIHLVRDGRDYVRSMMARPYRFADNPEKEDVATRYVRPKKGDNCQEKWASMTRFEKICWEWRRTNEYIRGHLKQKPAQMERMLSDFDYFKKYFLTPFGLKIAKELWAKRIKIQGKPDQRIVLPHYSEWNDEILFQFNKICGVEMMACGYGESYDSVS
ncbi:unnamed protein product, partial [marine sediment metagenome]